MIEWAVVCLLAVAVWAVLLAVLVSTARRPCPYADLHPLTGHGPGQTICPECGWCCDCARGAGPGTAPTTTNGTGG